MYCLTVIGRFTHWVEAKPLKNMETETIASVLYKIWIANFVIHKIITTDQDHQIELCLFLLSGKLLGSKHIHTCAFHSQANNMIENWHGTLKSIL